MSGVAWVPFVVAAGIGAVARYLIDGIVGDRTDGFFPWGTFVVNVSGCLMLGVLTGMALYHGGDDTVRTVLGTGGLGAFTTFSAFSVETIRLVEEGAVGAAARNAVGTFLCGLTAAGLGLAITAAW